MGQIIGELKDVGENYQDKDFCKSVIYPQLFSKVKKNVIKFFTTENLKH